MNNEIKEILDNMKEWSVEGNLYFEINDEKAKLLYDYITNLQEENEKIKRTCKLYYAELGDYEQKIDKVIEYINENSYFEGNAVKTMIYQDYSKYILEILQGKSDE